MSPGTLSNHIPDLRELRVQPTGGGGPGPWGSARIDDAVKRLEAGGLAGVSAVHQSANRLPLRVGLCAGAFDVGDVALGPFPDGTQGCQQ